MKNDNEAMTAELYEELLDFADKASGDRKTHVAACLVFPDGRRIFGANRLIDSHGLSERQIADRVRPEFYDAMKCGEADAINKATQLGLDLTSAKLFSMLLPCPRCAQTIVDSGITFVVAKKHRVSHNGKFDNSLEDTKKIFDDATVNYEVGEPDIR